MDGFFDTGAYSIEGFLCEDAEPGSRLILKAVSAIPAVAWWDSHRWMMT